MDLIGGEPRARSGRSVPVASCDARAGAGAPLGAFWPSFTAPRCFPWVRRPLLVALLACSVPRSEQRVSALEGEVGAMKESARAAALGRKGTESKLRLQVGEIEARSSLGSHRPEK